MESTITSFISSNIHNPDLSRVPLPDRFYKMFNLSPPDVMSMNEFVKSSMKNMFRGGLQSEIRKPSDNIVRVLPFVSTITTYDLSGNPEKFPSTILIYPSQYVASTIASYTDTNTINDNAS